MNLINKALSAAENDELSSDWRKEPAQYAPVIRELVARVAELEGLDTVRQVPKAIKVAPIGSPAKVEIVWECVGQERPNIHMECWHIDGANLVRGANIGALVGLANMLLDEAEKQGHSFAAQAKQEPKQ